MSHGTCLSFSDLTYYERVSSSIHSAANGTRGPLEQRRCLLCLVWGLKVAPGGGGGGGPGGGRGGEGGSHSRTGEAPGGEALMGREAPWLAPSAFGHFPAKPGGCP